MRDVIMWMCMTAFLCSTLGVVGLVFSLHMLIFVLD